MQATISKLQTAPTVAGQKSPLLAYFGVLLQHGALNEVESVEMARLVIAQNRKEMLTSWMSQNKLTPSEALGDVVKDVAGDSAMALQARPSSPYLRPYPRTISIAPLSCGVFCTTH